MARYFNRTRSSVAVTLARGGSVYVPSKCWLDVATEDESSADLVRVTQQGYLVRFASIGQAPDADGAGASVKTPETSREGN